MPWQPPIPQGALYTRKARELDAGLALLAYCYDVVRRDGTFPISLKEVAAEMDEPYLNVKRWWAKVRVGPWFSEVVDKGRSGFLVTFNPEWIDWRVLSARPVPAEAPQNVTHLTQPQVSKKILEEVVKDISSTDEVADLIPETPLKDISSTAEVSKKILEVSVYGTQDSDQAPPPPPTPSTPEPAPAAPGTAPSSAGGGGGRWRENQVYQLLRGAGIAAADRLMPAWNGVPPEQVEALLTKLRKELWSADGEGRIAGRIYRAMLDGPELLLRPPARSAARAGPTFTPPPRAAPTDPEAMRRALAAAKLKAPEGIET